MNVNSLLEKLDRGNDIICSYCQEFEPNGCECQNCEWYRPININGFIDHLLMEEVDEDFLTSSISTPNYDVLRHNDEFVCLFDAEESVYVKLANVDFEVVHDFLIMRGIKITEKQWEESPIYHWENDGWVET